MLKKNQKTPKKLKAQKTKTKKEAKPPIVFPSAKEIKDAVDKGDFALAKRLMDELAAPKVKSKPGRPKGKTAKPEEIIPEPKSSVVTGAERRSGRDLSSCVAPSKAKAPAGGQKIVRDGKEYTVMTKVPWAPPQKKNKFKDDGRTVAREHLNYPEPIPRERDVAEQVQFVCDTCNQKDFLYPSQFPDPDMLYFCEKCMKKKIGRR